MRLSLKTTIWCGWLLSGVSTASVTATVPHSTIEAYGVYNRAVTVRSSADKPTQSGIAKNCNAFYDVVSGDSCDSVERAFKITHAQFLAWNPAVSSDCSKNFWAGDSYCVGTSRVSIQSPTTTKPTSSKTAAPTPDKPYMSGSACNCNKWYDVVSGDNCDSVARAFGITINQFLDWNKNVSSDCSKNFWVNEAYCVGISGKACTSSTTTTKLTTTTRYSIISVQSTTAYTPVTPTKATSWPPSPTLSGQVANCVDWYYVQPGDSCSGIRALIGPRIDEKLLIQWNPALGSDCSGLRNYIWLCTRVRVATSEYNTTYAATPWYPPYTPTTYPSASFEPTPQPVPSPVISNCLAFQQASDTDTCNSMANTGWSSLQDFEAWNPSLNASTCSLQSGYYYCILKQGVHPPIPVVTATPTQNVQSGIAKNCAAWYQAVLMDTCGSISDAFGTFSISDFIQWNPAIGKDCNSIVANDFYCVSTPGVPTTRTATISPIPTAPLAPNQPQQSGIAQNCNGYWLVGQSDSCSSIAQMNGIAANDLSKWNPALGPNCAHLLPDYYVCVGISS